MNRVFSRLGLAAAIVAGAGTYAFAQTATTGAVSGTITDKAGAPVMGASVRLTSTQTSRTFLTGTDGSFRMGLLNPGAWTIEVTKPGFQKFSQNITILVNQNQPVTIKMAAEAATVVEVLGTATTIDNTTTQTGLVTSMDTLSAIPKGRDMNSIAMLAPGVVTGGSFGSGLGQHSDPSMGGGSGAENSYVVDGLSTTNTSRGFQGASLVTDFIDQVEVQTGGFKPEFSALGGVFNAITKSGTNEFKGSTWLTWDAIGIQAVPKKSIYFRPTDQSLNSRYDIGAEVGGPIIKDKLFFFAGVDGNITEAPNALPNNIGLMNSKDKVTTYQALAKINWYMTQDQQLTVSANVNSAKDDYPLLYPTTGNANLGYHEKNDTQNLVFNYDWTISPSLFFSAKLGTTQYKDTLSPSDSTNVAVTDNMYFTAGGPGGTGTAFTGLAFRGGGYGYHADEDKTQTTQARADLSWFLGTHNMKFGVSQVTSKYTEIASTTGGERVTIRRSAATGNFLGVDRQFLHTNASVKAIFTAFYAQDTWDVTSGVKLMYGFRYEIQDQRDLNDKTFLKFSNFSDQLQPRLGFTWDVNGDGRSKVSASYARYFESIPQRMAIRVYANETYLRYRYSAGNSSYNPTTGAYAYNTAGTGPSSITDFATPFSFDPIAEGVKLPQRNEYTLGYDHTFASGWTAGLHGKYRELKNPMEDMVFTDTAGNPYDEGPGIVFNGAGVPLFGAGAAVIGNPGGFQQWRPNPKSMTLYWLALGNANPNGAGAGFSYNSYGINILQYYNPATGLFTVPDTRFPKAGNKYASVDFTLDKKTDRDTFSFSYTWSRLEGNYEGVVSSSNGQADGNITASFDYYPYVGYGLLPNDRTHVVKLYASHRFDVAGNDMNLGVNYTYQSGNPVSYFDDGSSSNPPIADIGGYGNATPQNGLLGQYGRTPALNNVDAHLDYVYKMSSKMRLIPSVDMFNVFNTRYANGIYQQATDQSGSPDIRYGQATDWQIGRRYRFGIKLQF